MLPPSLQQPLIVVESDNSSNEDDSSGSPANGPRKQLGNTVRRRVRRPNVIGSDSDENDDSSLGERIRPAALKPPLRLDSGSESGGDASFVNIYEPGSYHKVRYSPVSYELLRFLLCGEQKEKIFIIRIPGYR
jgi:hypothetical protein